jgi:hypothetical protein
MLHQANMSIMNITKVPLGLMTTDHRCCKHYQLPVRQPDLTQVHQLTCVNLKTRKALLRKNNVHCLLKASRSASAALRAYRSCTRALGFAAAPGGVEPVVSCSMASYIGSSGSMNAIDCAALYQATSSCATRSSLYSSLLVNSPTVPSGTISNREVADQCQLQIRQACHWQT